MHTLLLAPVLCLALLAAPPAPALATGAVVLPAPRIEGKVPLERTLKERRSLRTPGPGPLSLADVGQLCWAAQGVTDDKGHRTAPSARATYPLELYVMAGSVATLAPGLYRYLPDRHALAPVSPGDQRRAFVQAAIGQGWIEGAPVIFVVTGVVERAAGKNKDRAAQFMWVEAGLAAQGLFLQATALGLGSTFVGGFDPQASRKALALQAGEDVLAVLPVGVDGRRAKAEARPSK